MDRPEVPKSTEKAWSGAMVKSSKKEKKIEKERAVRDDFRSNVTEWAADGRQSGDIGYGAVDSSSSSAYGRLYGVLVLFYPWEVSWFLVRLASAEVYQRTASNHFVEVVESLYFHCRVQLIPALLPTIVAGLILATYAQSVRIRRSPDMAQPRISSENNTAVLGAVVSETGLFFRNRLLPDSASMATWRHLLTQLFSNARSHWLATGDAVGTTRSKKSTGGDGVCLSERKWRFKIPRLTRKGGNISASYVQAAVVQGLVLCFIFGALVSCRPQMTFMVGKKRSLSICNHAPTVFRRDAHTPRSIPIENIKRTYTIGIGNGNYLKLVLLPNVEQLLGRSFLGEVFQSIAAPGKTPLNVCVRMCKGGGYRLQPNMVTSELKVYRSMHVHLSSVQVTHLVPAEDDMARGVDGHCGIVEEKGRLSSDLGGGMEGTVTGDILHAVRGNYLTSSMLLRQQWPIHWEKFQLLKMPPHGHLWKPVTLVTELLSFYRVAHAGDPRAMYTTEGETDSPSKQVCPTKVDKVDWGNHDMQLATVNPFENVMAKRDDGHRHMPLEGNEAVWRGDGWETDTVVGGFKSCGCSLTYGFMTQERFRMLLEKLLLVPRLREKIQFLSTPSSLREVGRLFFTTAINWMARQDGRCHFVAEVKTPLMGGWDMSAPYGYRSTTSSDVIAVGAVGAPFAVTEEMTTSFFIQIRRMDHAIWCIPSDNRCKNARKHPSTGGSVVAIPAWVRNHKYSPLISFSVRPFMSRVNGNVPARRLHSGPAMADYQPPLWHDTLSRSEELGRRCWLGIRKRASPSSFLDINERNVPQILIRANAAKKNLLGQRRLIRANLIWPDQPQAIKQGIGQKLYRKPY
ncbi:hypothetical protein BU17DRAFT_69592 [Hysterangium stoloniferum]|nr:hypothetical protein BU17DRAFT_69592 [Hysterangium stoloniferum]